MSAANALFTPVKVGPWDLAHRIVYAPLTRCRSENHIIPQQGSLYYAQRATEGGLMISEATVVDPRGFGYPRTPGIFTAEQTEAWKPVVKAVHEKGAKFLCQLWHCGRVSHQEYQPEGQDPVSASPIAVPKHKVLTSKGPVDHPVPRELSKEELKGVIKRFVEGAKNSLAAGFDGVEIHSANGYLLDSFLKSSSNQREDEYGGSIENRARWVLELIKAVADEIGPEKVGVRFSPFYVMGAEDEHKYAMFTYVLECINDWGLAYVHMVEPRAEGKQFEGSPSAVYEYRLRGQTLDVFRNAYKGTFLAAGGHTRQSGMDSVDSSHADLIVYGRLFLANPDLPKRFELDAPLNEYDRNTFYTADLEKGYTDYPFLTEEQIEAAQKNQASSSQGGKAVGKPKGHAEDAHLGNAY